jgi:hypothetical protein
LNTATNTLVRFQRRRVVAGGSAALAAFVAAALLLAWAADPGSPPKLRASANLRGGAHAPIVADVRPDPPGASTSPSVPTSSDPAPGLAPQGSGAGNCAAKTQVRPFPAGTTLTTQWKVGQPRPDTAYILDKVTSLAYPDHLGPSESVFVVGMRSPALRGCVVGGYVQGQMADTVTWEQAHARHNGACLLFVGTGSIDIRNLRCDNVEDGVRPEETARNANDATLNISGTYFTRVRDDCIENDFVLGGVLADNLWEQCNTGVSERPPSSAASFTSPKGESLTLDHMVLGLYVNQHRAGPGENVLFKWSSSANTLVIKCSMLKVDGVSLNGPEAMSFPVTTVIDDSACPANPTTLVWLGGGSYPGWLPAGQHPVVW